MGESVHAGADQLTNESESEAELEGVAGAACELVPLDERKRDVSDKAGTARDVSARRRQATFLTVMLCIWLRSSCNTLVLTLWPLYIRAHFGNTML